MWSIRPDNHVGLSLTFNVIPQSPSPAMRSILDSSDSASIKPMQARIIASVKTRESATFNFVIEGQTLAANSGIDVDLEAGEGAVLDDHLQPGAAHGSSRSERTNEEEGDWAGLIC